MFKKMPHILTKSPIFIEQVLIGTFMLWSLIINNLFSSWCRNKRHGILDSIQNLKEHKTNPFLAKTDQKDTPNRRFIVPSAQNIPFPLEFCTGKTSNNRQDDPRIVLYKRYPMKLSM